MVTNIDERKIKKVSVLLPLAQAQAQDKARTFGYANLTIVIVNRQACYYEVSSGKCVVDYSDNPTLHLWAFEKSLSAKKWIWS